MKGGRGDESPWLRREEGLERKRGQSLKGLEGWKGKTSQYRRKWEKDGKYDWWRIYLLDINAEKKIIKDCFIYNKYDKRNIYRIVSDTLHIAILSTHNNIEYTILYIVHNTVERTQ